MQDKFINVVNKTHEKLHQKEEKQGWGWFTAAALKTELKWSKPDPYIGNGNL